MNIFGPKVLETIQSKYSGLLEVRSFDRSIYVTTGGLTQSGGLIKDIWEPVLKTLKPPNNRSWLILGLATGTAAKIIFRKYRPAQIIGVEIDPVMIAIGKKYFDLDQIPNLKILNIDAKDYLLKTKDRFDFVLVDLYLGDQCPRFVYSKRFLEKLKKVGKLVIINHLVYDDTKRHDAEKLIKLLSPIFKNVRLQRILTNVLIICE
ncbi:MAG: hypothetical protein AAB860_00410 [Patescibacteria group bacterium]